MSEIVQDNKVIDQNALNEFMSNGWSYPKAAGGASGSSGGGKPFVVTVTAVQTEGESQMVPDKSYAEIVAEIEAENVLNMYMVVDFNAMKFYLRPAALLVGQAVTFTGLGVNNYGQCITIRVMIDSTDFVVYEEQDIPVY